MDIGAQSVAVFARPALPHTDATSGNVMRIESSTWSRRRCVVRDTAGRVLGMYISDPSFNGGMNSLPRPANGRSVSTRTPTAPPSTSHRAPIAQRSTGRYTLIAQRLRGFSASARIFPLTNHPMSAGTSVTESSAAAAIAKVLVSASGRNSRPSWSSSVNTGRNESVMMSSDMNSAGPTSRAAANTRSQCGRSGSCSKCLWRFSSITIAASIMAPIAIASPPRLMILPLMPSQRVTASDTRMPSGSVAIATRALRACSRNTAHTSATMTDSSSSVRHSVLMDPWIKTLWRTLLEESVIVALVCAVFLLHARSALVAIATLPLGILVSLAVTRWLGINGNIMSLGGIAIAIGAMIDAAIVMLENLHKHVEHEPDRPHWERVFAAAREVGPALFMSLLIITLSFLPVFTLEDQEGRLFRPLALTKTFAMAAAALLSVTLVPALMGWFVKGKIRAEAENPLNRWALDLYRPVLQWALRARWLVLGGAAGLILLTLLPLGVLGSEFMPPLNEGSLMYMPNTLPALSLTTQRRLLHVEDSILMTFPEVESVWGKAGRANTATDWAPMSMVETVVNLKPESEWRPGMTQDRLIAEMDQRLRLTGAVNTWTMPIKNRTDMLSTGVRTTLAVKIFGPDLQTIQRIGQDIERALAPLVGTASVYAERSFGGRYLDIRPDADALARYGLTTGDAQEVISLALGGEEITTTVEGRERYPVQVRYARDFRDDPTTISRLLVGSGDGPQVPLGQVADIQFSPGPPMIRSEGGYLYDQVSIDVGGRGRDVGSYVRDAQAVVARQVKLPTGYWLRWSGQYEAIQRVKARLQVVVPLTLGIIALLLYLTFGTVAETAIVMLSLPFALVGGVWIMWLFDYNLSIAVAVGFIALAGVAAETGVVMLIYLDHAWKAITQGGRRPTLAELVGAIEHGAVNRVRPKLMTVLAIMLGLVPALWSHGAGASVMKRIAAPMVGGMVTSTILTLIVIPVIYYLWRRRGLEGK